MAYLAGFTHKIEKIEAAARLKKNGLQIGMRLKKA
jgi:hypothetical protein